jgi:hypothetical protein
MFLCIDRRQVEMVRKLCDKAKGRWPVQGRGGGRGAAMVPSMGTEPSVWTIIPTEMSHWHLAAHNAI